MAFKAIHGLKTQSEIAEEFEIYPMMVGKWKKELLDHMHELFQSKADKTKQQKDKEKDSSMFRVEKR